MKRGEQGLDDSRDDHLTEQTPIFVISLARSKDRRARIAARLAELGLRFEFLEAVDGQDLSPYHRSLVDYSFSDFQRDYGRTLSKGEIGCALSHALAYKKIVEENIPYAVIMEDDTLPSREFAELIKRELLPKQSKIGLATFYYQTLSVWRWSGIELCPSIHALRPMEHPWRAACYYLTQSAAADLLRSALPVSGVADWPTLIHKWSSAYCIAPLLVETPLEPEHSTLYSERDILMKHSNPPRETMAMVYWKTPWRILGRLATLTIFPCLLWPEIFGTVDNTRQFVANVLELLKILFFGKTIEGVPT